MIGVFHTLSDGKAGQFVPGRTGPLRRGDDLDTGGPLRVFAFDALGAATNTNPAITTDAPTIPRRRLGRLRALCSTPKVYFAHYASHEGLSKSCPTSPNRGGRAQ